jgi:hypothetical protein
MPDSRLARETGLGLEHGISSARGRSKAMATHVIFHEVDDVEHWLSSPKREEVFGPMGITVRTFRDPQGSNRVGLIVEIPDMAAFRSFMQTDEAAEAMKYDGVRPETLLILDEA